MPKGRQRAFISENNGNEILKKINIYDILIKNMCFCAATDGFGAARYIIKVQ